MKVRVYKRVVCGSVADGLCGYFYRDIDMPMPPFVGMSIRTDTKSDSHQDIDAHGSPPNVIQVSFDEPRGIIFAEIESADYRDETYDTETFKNQFEYETNGWIQMLEMKRLDLHWEKQQQEYELSESKK